METELVDNLVELSSRYCAAKSLETSTVGRLCASDSRFFSRIMDGQTFTAKKYDKVVVWFWENWPAGTEWPKKVKKPK